jgi:D-apionolactonase
VPPVPLCAGPLRLLYEPATGFLRRVCLGEREVLRGIYAAVRDRNWGTIPGVVREMPRKLTSSSFLLEFRSEHRQEEIDFVWHGTISGESDGVVRYEFDGEARTTFWRNRIGFCVLHPIRECAGASVRQTRVDGSLIECKFPVTIEPQIFGQSSFRDLGAVAHEVAPGLWAEVVFEGDVFEMEDQRNWTDASFKTYCTPLTLPFPVEIKAGTRIRQRVTLRLVGSAVHIGSSPVEITDAEPEAVTVSIEETQIARLPRIGLGMASHGKALTETEGNRLRALQLAHLRADLRLSMPDWVTALECASREARQLSIGIELAIHLPRAGSGDLSELQFRLQALPCELVRVLALREGEAATSPETLHLIRQALVDMKVPIGAGSDANFCELNREQALGRLALSEADFLYWPMNPQVHAFDHLSIMETLEAQGDALRTARAFAGGRPLAISPVTLKPRFNPVATAPSVLAGSGELPPPVDPRQLSLFAAAWTLGSLAGLANSGADSVTFFETTGWRGVMERECGSELPGLLPSSPASLFPVYQVLACLAACDGYLPVRVSAPSVVAALAICDRRGSAGLLLGNLTSQLQRVHLLTSAPTAQVRVLDFAAMQATLALHPQSSSRVAARNGFITLNLPPYAIAFQEEGTDRRSL